MFCIFILNPKKEEAFEAWLRRIYAKAIQIERGSGGKPFNDIKDNC